MNSSGTGLNVDIDNREASDRNWKLLTFPERGGLASEATGITAKLPQSAAPVCGNFAVIPVASEVTTDWSCRLW
jgi:hypothetical protein